MSYLHILIHPLHVFLFFLINLFIFKFFFRYMLLFVTLGCFLILYYIILSESELALFTKCAQTHKEFVVVFKVLYIIILYYILDWACLFALWPEEVTLK